MLDDINAGLSVTDAATLNGIKSGTAVHAWVKKEASISVGGQGRLNSFPHCDEVVQWIKQMRRNDFPLKTSHVLVFLKEGYADFTTDYLAKNKEESLDRMIRRIIHQRGVSSRRPTKSILSTQDLEKQRKFTSGVDAKTAIYYDDTPTRIITTGRKLCPVIIFKGQPAGCVEEEVKGISNKVVTAVQKGAWMDARVLLDTFAEEAWGDFISDTSPEPLALYIDNLKCHPLDVGVMGPFKQKLRAVTLSYELEAIRTSGHVPLRQRLLKLQRLSAPEKRKHLVERVVTAWDLRARIG
uniref:DDE-1 domain-containing protein n=1 Tax=Phytophthora ramorum TaxID=164328 RepID=H3GNL0_PHYRM